MRSILFAVLAALLAVLAAALLVTNAQSTEAVETASKGDVAPSLVLLASQNKSLARINKSGGPAVATNGT